MHVLTLTGFFGSGKTSFILRAARFYTGVCGQRIAILQNEINGEGVDDKVLRTDGLVVSELVGGCICCKLSSELIATVRKIHRDLAPDVLIIEASGMATPSLLRELLEASDLRFDSLRQIALLDASRYARIERLLDVPLLRQGVETADICLLNKLDIAGDDARDRFRREARAANPDCRLFETSLTDDDHLPDGIRAALLTPPEAGSPQTAPRPAHPGNAPGEYGHGHAPAVFSAQIRPATWSWTAASVRHAFAAYLAELRRAGCSQVGHIKVFAELSNGKGFLLSVTDLDQEPVLPDGDLLQETTDKITLNSIVYGVEHARLTSLSRAFLDALEEGAAWPGAVQAHEDEAREQP